ncbi:DUF4282 domain-containing protein [Pinisolibacter sp.]|uniref:DUF4282 domain-containing protein n=1 Tax=Pinisolibacter sp. TaxID=2172024 RepID=UPI002FDCD057
MFDQLLALDAFLAPRLIRPFYLIGAALALLWGLSGFLVGLVLLVQIPWAGVFTITFSLLSALLLFLGVRLFAEGLVATLRMHTRFVGGNPRDPIPE